MALVQRAGYCARIAIPLLLLAGCSVPKPAVRQNIPVAAAPVASQPVAATALQSHERAEGPVRQVVHQLPATSAPEPHQDDGMFSGQDELSLPELMREVEARNPSVQAMAYAWRAAAQRYPQAVSLDDPMFMTMVAPASFGSNQVQPGYILSGSQKLPWFGKRDIRGQAAQSEATAAFHDMNGTR